MEFNIPKCVHLPITNKTKPRLHSYSLCGVSVSSHPYLGIKLDTKLTWANHITDIASKSSKVLGMIKRTLGPCIPDVKETAYNMLVRPKLEYASPIWNPHTTTQIKHLEKVQHCAARFVKNNHRRQTATTDLIATLGWPTLERRRIIKQAMTFYKILNNNQHHTTTGPTKTIKKPWPLHRHQVPHQHCSVLLLPPCNSHREYDPTTHYCNRKSHSFSSSNNEPPLPNTQSPKLPVKQTNKL